MMIFRIRTVKFNKTMAKLRIDRTSVVNVTLTNEGVVSCSEKATLT